MATTDDLIIAIRADVGQLQQQLANVNRQLSATQNQGDSTSDSIRGMAASFLGLAAAVEGMKKLVEVNRNFGILKAGLETATGSIEGANQAFAALQQFAQTTPYSLQQAVDGFTKLVNLGLTPSEAALKSYGDTSAALGKDLSQMIEAVADASTGEFERLKEFGIKAKNQGDTIAFTFKGMTETVGNSAAEIEQYLIKLGQVNFDGAMKKRMDSLDGAISNLSDSFDAFFFEIGEAGATNALNSSLRQLGGGLTLITEKIKQIPIQSFNEGLERAGEAVLVFAGYKLTKMAAAMAVSTQETIRNMAASAAARTEAVANANADSVAANIASRRAVVERELAMQSLNRARATAAAAVTAQQAAIADAEQATMQLRLAAGTQNATAAALARIMALERLSQAQLHVVNTANAEAAALAIATTATGANTAAATAATAAQTALGTATATANVAIRASSTLLATLGGPIGAITAALGLAATAWLVFGDNAETGADKAKDAAKRIKEGLNGATDEMRNQTDELMRVNYAIQNYTKLASSPIDKTRNFATTQLESLRQEKALIEENINNLKLTKVLDDFLGENKEDSLVGFGVKKDKQPQAAEQKDNQEAKKLEQLKSAAQAYLNQIAESNMTEAELESKHFTEQLQQLDKYLQQKAISKSQYDAAILESNSAFIGKIYEQQLEQQAKEDDLALKQQEREDANRERRMASIQELINEANNAGMTELERMDAQHAAKMAKLGELAEGESIYKQELRDAETALEQQHEAKKLDAMLGTGSKIQEMQKAFNKSKLQGALSFFAADMGGMSQHSRKMFELQKAAALANAVISIPETVMAAAAQGTKMGGWPMGLAMGAAALAGQLSQLRAIQSATFGGGSGGSGGGGSASSAMSGGTSQQQAQQPMQQRFVNLNLYGGSDTMYSKESVRMLMSRMAEEVKDGAVLRVS